MDTLERLSIIEELRRVMARYVHFADQQRWEDLAGLFTPDGTFTPHKPDGSVWMRMQGRDEIVATLQQSGGADVVLIHHLFSDEIDVDSPTSARGVWSMEDLISRVEGTEIPEGLPFVGMHGFGHYHAQFLKTDGLWRITELIQTRLRLDFTH
ncbi:nuclear transport factor 2 family protein [Nocardia tengchongensis]|uniref:nuclear transport factor 2 family protein n=1 Tax=Nocardia tengchongensis TaxID=2055889 RepID=UPI00361E2F63